MNNLSANISALLGGNFSEAKIAKAVGTSQTTINRIKLGGTTSYEVGKAIETLYSLHCSKPVAATLATAEPVRHVG